MGKQNVSRTRGQTRYIPVCVVFVASLVFCVLLVAEYPRFVYDMIHAVIDNGGLSAEGIFRVSATKAAVEEARERVSYPRFLFSGFLCCVYVPFAHICDCVQCEDGKYEMKRLDPHIPANLLKEWLRSASVFCVVVVVVFVCVAVPDCFVRCQA